MSGMWCLRLHSTFALGGILLLFDEFQKIFPCRIDSNTEILERMGWDRKLRKNGRINRLRLGNWRKRKTIKERRWLWDPDLEEMGFNGKRKRIIGRAGV